MNRSDVIKGEATITTDRKKLSVCLKGQNHLMCYFP